MHYDVTKKAKLTDLMDTEINLELGHTAQLCLSFRISTVTLTLSVLSIKMP